MGWKRMDSEVLFWVSVLIVYIIVGLIFYHFISGEISWEY